MTVNKTIMIEIEVPDKGPSAMDELCTPHGCMSGPAKIERAEKAASVILEKHFRQEVGTFFQSVRKVTIGSGQHGVSDIVIT